MLLAAVAWTGCGDDNGTGEPAAVASLSLSTGTLLFEADGQVSGESADRVTVASSGEWRLAGRQLWCEPSAVEGVDGDEVNFTVQPNESLEARSVTFTFMCGSREERLTVTQLGGSVLDLEGGGTLELGPEGGDVRVKMWSSSQTSCRFEEEVDWMHPAVTAASRSELQPSFLYFTVDPNTTGRAREARLILSNAEGDERTAVITQHKNLVLELIGESTFAVPVKGQEIGFQLRSNVELAVESEEWIVLLSDPDHTGDLVEQTLNFRVEPTSEAFRNGTIRITSPEDESLLVEVFVNQGEKPQGVHFPDAAFREILIANGYVTLISGDECEITEKGQNATTLPLLRNKGIESLQGIEAFKNIVDLGAEGIMTNSVKVLDLSGNPNFKKLYYTSSFSGKRSYLDTNPIEQLILGDAPIENGYVFLANLYNFNAGLYSQSVTVSGTKVLTVDISLTSYDQVKWLDVTGCPNITTIVLHSYYLKTLYVTQEQKEAIDGGSITIQDSNYPTSTLQIIVR